MKIHLRPLLALACAAFVAAAGAAAAPKPAPLRASEQIQSTPSAPSTGSYRVPLYKSTIVPLRRAAKRVSVGNPGVADFIVTSKSQLYVVGKALGSTNVVVWDDAGQVFGEFDVEVTHDLDTLKTKLHDLMPDENIKVHSAQEQLILSGQVSSPAKATAARDLAQGFLPDCIRAMSDVAEQAGVRTSGSRLTDPSCKKGSVVNLMQVGGANQVMLKVTVAEMARSVVKKLDTNLALMRFGGRVAAGAASGGAAFPDALDQNGLLSPILGGLGGSSPIGPAIDLFSPTTPVIDDTGLFLSYLNNNVFAQAVLDISKRNGLAKILSEPTLTTLTGQEAQFLSGGEFPIPVPQGGTSNAVTVEFKEFGVGVKFLPTVLDSGRVNLAINVSVSELASDNVVVLRNSSTTNTFVIPSLTKRSASSTVELGDGQTIGIAGLINDNLREFVQKFPYLGDIPVLGALFRSQEFVSGQTELVIFVTPYLAKPIKPSQMKLPTDNFVPADDLQFYLMGKMSRGKDRDVENVPVINREAAPAASFGHDVNAKP